MQTERMRVNEIRTFFLPVCYTPFSSSHIGWTIHSAAGPKMEAIRSTANSICSTAVNVSGPASRRGTGRIHRASGCIPHRRSGCRVCCTAGVHILRHRRAGCDGRSVRDARVHCHGRSDHRHIRGACPDHYHRTGCAVAGADSSDRRTGTEPASIVCSDRRAIRSALTTAGGGRCGVEVATATHDRLP